MRPRCCQQSVVAKSTPKLNSFEIQRMEKSSAALSVNTHTKTGRALTTFPKYEAWNSFKIIQLTNCIFYFIIKIASHAQERIRSSSLAQNVH